MRFSSFNIPLELLGFVFNYILPVRSCHVEKIIMKYLSQKHNNAVTVRFECVAIRSWMKIVFIYVQLLYSVVLFCSDHFICNSELSEALNLLHCFRKRTFYPSHFINRFVTHTLFLKSQWLTT